MCGIAGFWDPRRGVQPEVLKGMLEVLRHRGPDAQGTWHDNGRGVALGHRRLSILDPSEHGQQPMRSASERYVIVFNGEIYNHLELRHELERSGHAPVWRGHADTETLLAAFDAWGIPAALRRSVGMFAFALWDRADATLHLARDRMGEKPLYYGWQDGALLFGSELKALRLHPSFEGEIDRNALALFLRHAYIPAPASIYKAVCKLPAGTCLTIGEGSDGRLTESGSRPVPYWSVSEAVEAGKRVPFQGTSDEATLSLEARIKESVRLQMVADVPVGAFLSGGIDSSTVVALMQAQSSQRIRTFTVGFDERGYDEAVFGKTVAAHLGTDHTELYVTPKEAMDVIPILPLLYDEPFADSSQIPTYLISQLARRKVTVSLSGDGGDELFGGYDRYLLAKSLWSTFGRIPTRARRVLAKSLRMLPPAAWSFLSGPFASPARTRGRHRPVGDRAHKLADILSACDSDDLYRELISQWRDPGSVILGATEPIDMPSKRNLWPPFEDFEHRMMFLDAINYLPDDILVKVDRAAMGVSLETRIPLLDHRVVELAWTIPLAYKIRRGQGKWILRQLLHKYLPRELVDRPKRGFTVPIDSWLRGPLRAWAENLIDPSRLQGEGYFQVDPVRKKWSEHLSGQRNWQSHLWSILMFQSWLEHQRT